MRVGFRQGLALWRRVGTRAALRGAGQLGKGAAREARLRARPLRVGKDELSAALGGAEPVEALRGPVLLAMPTVARFEADPADSPHTAPLLAHRFDLLGSGPTDLGREIDWSKDFKTGRTWPLHQSSLLRVAYEDGSDVKVPWELSRFQHLPLLAATGHVDEVGAQLESWIEANPVELGVNWTDDDGRRDPRGELGGRARALRRRSRRAVVRAHAREPAPARALHPLPPRVERGSRKPLPLERRRPAARSRRSSSGAARARDWAQWAAGELGLGDGAPGPPRRRRARGLDLLPPARDRALRLRDAGRGCARARLDSGLVSRAPRPDARLRARLHAARRARAADRGRGRRAVPPARRLRRRSARPSASLRPGRATTGAGGRERRISGRWLLRPSKRQPVRDRPLRRRRPLRRGRPRPQRPALVRARRCPRPARGRPRHATSTRRTRSSETGSGRRRSTRRCASAAASRTSFGRTTSSRWTDRAQGRGALAGTRRASRGATTASRVRPTRGASSSREDGLRIRDTVTSPESQELEWTFPLAPGAEERDRDRGGWPRVPRRARLVLAELRRSRADDVPARATTVRGRART